MSFRIIIAISLILILLFEIGLKIYISRKLKAIDGLSKNMIVNEKEANARITKKEY